MNTPTLKPCKVCGGPALLLRWHIHVRDIRCRGWLAKCADEKCPSCKFFQFNRELAALEWNNENK